MTILGFALILIMLGIFIYTFYLTLKHGEPVIIIGLILIVFIFLLSLIPTKKEYEIIIPVKIEKTSFNTSVLHPNGNILINTAAVINNETNLNKIKIQRVVEKTIYGFNSTDTLNVIIEN